MEHENIIASHHPWPLRGDGLLRPEGGSHIQNLRLKTIAGALDPLLEAVAKAPVGGKTAVQVHDGERPWWVTKHYLGEQAFWTRLDLRDRPDGTAWCQIQIPYNQYAAVLTDGRRDLLRRRRRVFFWFRGVDVPGQWPTLDAMLAVMGRWIELPKDRNRITVAYLEVYVDLFYAVVEILRQVAYTGWAKVHDGHLPNGIMWGSRHRDAHSIYDKVEKVRQALADGEPQYDGQRPLPAWPPITHVERAMAGEILARELGITPSMARRASGLGPEDRLGGNHCPLGLFEEHTRHANLLRRFRRIVNIPYDALPPDTFVRGVPDDLMALYDEIRPAYKIARLPAQERDHLRLRYDEGFTDLLRDRTRDAHERLLGSDMDVRGSGPTSIWRARMARLTGRMGLADEPKTRRRWAERERCVAARLITATGNTPTRELEMAYAARAPFALAKAGMHRLGYEARESLERRTGEEPTRGLLTLPTPRGAEPYREWLADIAPNMHLAPGPGPGQCGIVLRPDARYPYPVLAPYALHGALLSIEEGVRWPASLEFWDAVRLLCDDRSVLGLRVLLAAATMAGRHSGPLDGRLFWTRREYERLVGLRGRWAEIAREVAAQLSRFSRGERAPEDLEPLLRTVGPIRRAGTVVEMHPRLYRDGTVPGDERWLRLRAPALRLACLIRRYCLRHRRDGCVTTRDRLIRMLGRSRRGAGARVRTALEGIAAVGIVTRRTPRRQYRFHLPAELRMGDGRAGRSRPGQSAG